MSATDMLSEADLTTLRISKARLESPGVFVRITQYVGDHINASVHRLPEATQRKIVENTRSALEWAMGVTFGTLNPASRAAPSIWAHRVMVAGTGAAGGAIGLLSLPVELPLTTGIMFRSIADIARSEGEDVSTPEGKLACLTVFGLSPSASPTSTQRVDEELESGYYAMIFAFSKAVMEGVEHTAQKVFLNSSSGAIGRFFVSISERFGIAVSERALAMAVPAVGALGGVIVNSLFLYEFQELALGHFAIRRLDRTYGHDTVKAAYESIIL